MSAVVEKHWGLEKLSIEYYWLLGGDREGEVGDIGKRAHEAGMLD